MAAHGSENLCMFNYLPRHRNLIWPQRSHFFSPCASFPHLQNGTCIMHFYLVGVLIQYCSDKCVWTARTWRKYTQRGRKMARDKEEETIVLSWCGNPPCSPKRSTAGMEGEMRQYSPKSWSTKRCSSAIPVRRSFCCFLQADRKLEASNLAWETASLRATGGSSGLKLKY